MFFSESHGPFQETTRIGTFLGDRDREQRLNGWWVDEAISYRSKCVCVCGFGYMLTYSNCSFQEGQHNRKLVGRLIYEYCADMVQFQLESHVLIMSWWRILWEDPGCLWYAAMARQMLQAFLYKGTQLGTKAKTAITNVRNCHVHPSPILHHVAVDCSTSNTSCIWMSFSLLFSIISRFPSKKICCRYWGFNSYPHLFQKPKPPSPPQTPTAGTGTTGDPVLRLLHLCRFGS